MPRFPATPLMAAPRVATLLVAALGAAFLFPGPASADDVPVALGDIAHWSLARCGSPCVIRDNGGGRVAEFERAARQARRRGVRIEIRGRCDSACTVMADRARPHVCVTEWAQLRFHMGYDWDAEGRYIGRSPISYNPDIAAWISDRGGLPTTGLLAMSGMEALRFFPHCGASAHARHGVRPWVFGRTRQADGTTSRRGSATVRRLDNATSRGLPKWLPPPSTSSNRMPF